MSLWRERLSEAREAAVDRVGIAVVDRERLSLLEARDREAGYLRRELDSLAYTALNHAGGMPQDLKPEERLKLVSKARVVWQRDPQAGAAVDLLNDFVFGSGVAKPKANDPLVQDVIDEFWADPDNEDTITSYEAQLQFGIDLSLQSNVFVQVFDDGDDGKVKLAVLDHDQVRGVVRDPAYKRRILYYQSYEPIEEVEDWDYDTDAPLLSPNRRKSVNEEIIYYPHWRNVERAQDDYEEGRRDKLPSKPPPHKLGEGKVFQISVNKTGEMAFGHPTFDRLIGWFNAYNRFMDARVDMMEAQAAFTMKKKVKGTPGQLQKQATQALSRRSSLGLSYDPVTGEERQVGPKPASIINENEGVTWEDFKITTGAAEASQDARMLGAQVSAATRFPRSYYGDADASNLATATSLELPVLKAVENRQEIVERLIRFSVDRAIERAVDTSRIPKDLTPEERDKLAAKKNPERQSGAPPLGLPPAGMVPGSAPPVNGNGQQPPLQLGEAHAEIVEDEADTERDLGYEFKMPNPLKRMLTDLITAIQNIARTFDPNNTNMELSRTLLTIALGEGMELEDPAAAVDKIFPEGYVDPAVAAAQAQFGMPVPGEEEEGGPFGPYAPQSGAPGADGQRHQAGNPYGGPMQSTPPEKVQESSLWPRDRQGAPVDPRILAEVRIRSLPPGLRARFGKRMDAIETEFNEKVAALIATGGETT